MDDMYNFESENVTLDVLADRRQWALERIEKQTLELAEKVREEHAAGVQPGQLAKRAKVSRPTIYSWLKE